jgi:sterol desaturase/sphingolipid hydroxylase (fatty acid hydroxylase superfamily)
MSKNLLESQAILWAIPLMLFLVGIERMIAGKKGIEIGSWEETLSNIKCGLGQLVIELPVKGSIVLIYLATLKLSPWKIETSWQNFLFSFVLTDFLHYWYHRAHHAHPLLWRIHLVHHQPEDFNYSVGLRLPWLHKLTVLPFYLAQALIGVPIEIFIGSVSLHALLQIWNHTKLIRGKWGLLNYLIVTPSHHRVHHGKNERYIDRNFAAIFSVWDWLFGTYTEEDEDVVYGIRSKTISRLDVIDSNLGPLFGKPEEAEDSSWIIAFVFGGYALVMAPYLSVQETLVPILISIMFMRPRGLKIFTPEQGRLMKILLFLMSLTLTVPSFAGVSIISDFDDTIKTTNVADPVNMTVNGLFKEKVFDGMTEFFRETRAYSRELHILTASPSVIKDQVEETLEENRIDYTTIIFKNYLLKEDKMAYKVNKIASILSSSPDQFILLGDDVDKDPEVFEEVRRLFPDRILASYIHLVRNRPVPKGSINYVTAAELAAHEATAGRMGQVQADRVILSLLVRRRLDGMIPEYAYCPTQGISASNTKMRMLSQKIQAHCRKRDR